MVHEVFFDAETQKLFNEIHTDNPADLGLSVVSVYDRYLDEHGVQIRGEMRSFWEDELEPMWSIFQDADRIVGFNSFHFDVPLLDRYADFPFSELKHFDMLDQVKQALGKRLSLNVLVRDTLGLAKSDVGTNAVLYWKKGDDESLKKLREYCEHDVLITRDLYDYVKLNRHVKFKDKWNNIQTVPLDFSYQADESEMIGSDESQLGLF